MPSLDTKLTDLLRGLVAKVGVGDLTGVLHDELQNTLLLTMTDGLVVAQGLHATLFEDEVHVCKEP